MSLPIRITPDDISAVCGYLVTKPTGARLAEAKAIVEKKHLERRKLTALKSWGLVEDDGNKMKISGQGRQYVKDSGAHSNEVLRMVIRQVGPYLAVVERVVHRREDSIDSNEVAAHWHEHFRDEASDSEGVLNEQVLCFFHIAQGADLGRLTIGRRGMPTRFEFDVEATRLFFDGTSAVARELELPTNGLAESDYMSDEVDVNGDEAGSEQTVSATNEPDNNRVFITHGKNRKILDQVKEVVTLGKFEPVVVIEHETSAKPVPHKLMDDMRRCEAAVIHVCGERVVIDDEGEEAWQINENVLIEIGAAMALYGSKFVLLVEEGIVLPSNLQGLYECRYKGDELSLSAAMKLLRALNEL